MLQTQTSFTSFWKDLFLEPKDFFRTHFDERRPVYFLMALFIFGIGNSIDRIDNKLTRADLSGKLDQSEFINDWPVYWLMAIIFGLIGGYIAYMIGGWFFNVRLKWAKGTGNLEKSRLIYLYSGVVSSAVVLLVTIVNTFLEKKPYVAETEFPDWEAGAGLAVLACIYYSVYVSYCAVITITDAEEKKAKLWFLYLPWAMYSIKYIALIGVVIGTLI